FGPGDFIFRTDSDLGQLAAIRAGIGIGVCHVALAAREPDLVRVLPDAFEMAFETWVVAHENMRHVRRVRLVMDRLIAGLTAYAS
ncbi:DNA-binding transcriptional LysR family regulator, partial [Pseudorhodobacter sp. 4114]|nr:DNA-binding transcriptional LysR family regulator [Pseudorhodobacter sp. 4114]